ncbi:MAG TPA: Dna2/Cas4 domain-containing protein [Ktedonobacteraceae bacterium]|jgi:CRISPR-associated exonuclease Cas4|nr:Dna2/Cas4 domain-containing protein [Ktedonobacteraceae bacterium]
MQQRTHKRKNPAFSANEVAEFEYCPLVWWYEQFDPLMEQDNEALFAEMVAIEDEYGSEAPNLPDYQFIERLLVQRGATFDQNQETTYHDEEDADTEESDEPAAATRELSPLLRWGTKAVALLIVALLLITLAFALHIQPAILRNGMLAVGLLLALIAFALLLLIINEQRSQRQRQIKAYHQELGLPPGKLVYENVNKKGEAISSDQCPLTGKPDYIVTLDDGRMVPLVQNRSVHDAIKPYNNHEVLIAAYCLILEDYAQVAPTHGIMRYADREFIVDYTPTLRKRVLRRIKEMQQCSATQAPPLARQKITKCRSCTFQPICDIGRDK